MSEQTKAGVRAEIRKVAEQVSKWPKWMRGGSAACDADCTTGPEGGVLHSVAHQFSLAGGKTKACALCGKERHPGARK